MIYKAAHIDIVIVIKQFLSTENDFHTHELNDEGRLILWNILHKHFSFRKVSMCSKNAITLNRKST